MVAADIARRRDSGMLETPDSSRPNQSPLGAIHLPQAPTSVAVSSSPKSTFDGSGEVKLSSTFVDFRIHLVRPHGFPSPDVGLVAVL
jgi:hypothetical protein